MLLSLLSDTDRGRGIDHESSIIGPILGDLIFSSHGVHLVVDTRSLQVITCFQSLLIRHCVDDGLGQSTSSAIIKEKRESAAQSFCVRELGDNYLLDHDDKNMKVHGTEL